MIFEIHKNVNFGHSYIGNLRLERVMVGTENIHPEDYTLIQEFEEYTDLLDFLVNIPTPAHLVYHFHHQGCQGCNLETEYCRQNHNHHILALKCLIYILLVSNGYSIYL